jgi:hypothetical protein
MGESDQSDRPKNVATSPNLRHLREGGDPAMAATIMGTRTRLSIDLSQFQSALLHEPQHGVSKFSISRCIADNEMMQTICRCFKYPPCAVKYVFIRFLRGQGPELHLKNLLFKTCYSIKLEIDPN